LGRHGPVRLRRSTSPQHPPRHRIPRPDPKPRRFLDRTRNHRHRIPQSLLPQIRHVPEQLATPRPGHLPGPAALVAFPGSLDTASARSLCLMTRSNESSAEPSGKETARVFVSSLLPALTSTSPLEIWAARPPSFAPLPRETSAWLSC